MDSISGDGDRHPPHGGSAVAVNNGDVLYDEGPSGLSGFKPNGGIVVLRLG
ncbi:MAG: hypothetical protein HYZ37_03675 [Candidatus Solibacter usitatus]|nr:hypothetical protein [Candidatus Solibacter usitatus]